MCANLHRQASEAAKFMLYDNVMIGNLIGCNLDVVGLTTCIVIVQSS